MQQQTFGQSEKPESDRLTGCTNAVMSVFDESVALYLRLRAIGEVLHEGSGLSGAMRGVLRDLHKIGPQTVPRLARRRPVTRQHIQAITNELLEMGLVELVDNPAHKRSRLIQLTAAGHGALEELNQREIAMLKRVAVPVSSEDLRAACRVLVDLRQAMESDEWRRAVREMARQRQDEDGVVESCDSNSDVMG